MSDNLPPLPKHIGFRAVDYTEIYTVTAVYTADQMRTYAAQAVAERDAEIASLREANERAYNAGFVEASRLHGAEIERLRAELEDERELRERMRDILCRVAVALRGPEPELTRWSWHDLPERAAAAVAAIDVMRRTAEIVAEATAQHEPADVLAEYQGDGARQWVTVGAWLRPGERIVHVGGNCQGILDSHEGGAEA